MLHKAIPQVKALSAPCWSASTTSTEEVWKWTVRIYEI